MIPHVLSNRRTTKSSARAAAGVLMWTCLAVQAAGAQTLTDNRVWWNVTVQERAGTASQWRWYMEVQGRHRAEGRDFDQLLVRPAVGYDLTSRSSLWLGGGYTPVYPASGDTLHEHRYWQQYLWSGPALGGAFQSRSRVEQRAIDGNDGVAWRVREFVRHTTTVSQRRQLTVVVWDEVFVHLNDTTRTSGGFDQNRLFAGIGVPAGRRGRLEIGYLNQSINGGRAVDRRHHAVLSFLNLTY
jgi:hypothetical protein